MADNDLRDYAAEIMRKALGPYSDSLDFNTTDENGSLKFTINGGSYVKVSDAPNADSYYQGSPGYTEFLNSMQQAVSLAYAADPTLPLHFYSEGFGTVDFRKADLATLQANTTANFMGILDNVRQSKEIVRDMLTMPVDPNKPLPGGLTADYLLPKDSMIVNMPHNGNIQTVIRIGGANNEDTQKRAKAAADLLNQAIGDKPFRFRQAENMIMIDQKDLLSLKDDSLNIKVQVAAGAQDPGTGLVQAAIKPVPPIVAKLPDAGHTGTVVADAGATGAHIVAAVPTITPTQGLGDLPTPIAKTMNWKQQREAYGRNRSDLSTKLKGEDLQALEAQLKKEIDAKGPHYYRDSHHKLHKKDPKVYKLALANGELDVRALQADEAAAGYKVGGVDGLVGDKTWKATEAALQKAHPALQVAKV